MKSFMGSNATKAILALLLAELLITLAPMLREHAIDFWRLGEVLCLHAGALIVNAFRGDIDASGFNWLNGPSK